MAPESRIVLIWSATSAVVRRVRDLLTSKGRDSGHLQSFDHH